MASENCERVIVAAAIRYGDLVICGVRHFDLLMHGVIGRLPKDCFPDGTARAEQGFVDNRGKFLTRDQAREVAEAAGQIKRSTGTGEKLFSEDLW